MVKVEWTLTSENTVKQITQVSNNAGFTVYVYYKVNIMHVSNYKSC